MAALVYALCFIHWKKEFTKEFVWLRADWLLKLFLYNLQNIRHYRMYSNISFTMLEIESLWWPLFREIRWKSNLNNNVWKKWYPCYFNYSFIIAHRAILMIAFLQVQTIYVCNHVGVNCQVWVIKEVVSLSRGGGLIQLNGVAAHERIC